MPKHRTGTREEWRADGVVYHTYSAYARGLDGLWGERITVLSGILNLGSGDTFDEKKAKALSPGTYSSMPPKMTHFAWMTGETILQLSSLGPWTITYVNPADDPRKK